MESPLHEQPVHGAPAWNEEVESLTFIRDEGLALLSLFRAVRDEKKRQLIVDLIRLLADA